jgi:hypothetical protein
VAAAPVKAPINLAPAQEVDLFPKIAPARRGLPQFRPSRPRLRILEPDDLRALPAAPHGQLVRVNARVARIELVFDGEHFHIGAALNRDVVVPVKQSLARLLIGAGPDVWCALPPFEQEQRIHRRCGQRLRALEPPLLVIDRGGADPANRFELTTGEHEIDATRV